MCSQETFMYFYQLLLTFLYFERVSGLLCSRLHSREARIILQDVFHSTFESHNVAVPPSCPFHPHRDMYLAQERVKVVEGPSKWYCDYCGKGFLSEYYLDKHFDNRHSDTVSRGPDMVCLADYCAILRCDIVNQRRQVSYWEQVLCKEEAMQALTHTCQQLVAACIPGGLEDAKRRQLQDDLRQSLCSYLTCERIYEVPTKEDSPFYVAAYVITLVILMMGLATYYVITYFHFFDSISPEEETKKRELLARTSLQSAVPGNTGVRNRLPFTLPR